MTQSFLSIGSEINGLRKNEALGCRNFWGEGDSPRPHCCCGGQQQRRIYFIV